MLNIIYITTLALPLVYILNYLMLENHSQIHPNAEFEWNDRFYKHFKMLKAMEKGNS